jgi:hypothetical protein
MSTAFSVKKGIDFYGEISFVIHASSSRKRSGDGGGG